MRLTVALFAVLCGAFTSAPASAANAVQGRLFAGAVAISPTDFNEEIQADGLKKMSATLLLGAEASYALLNNLEFGLRYMKNQVSRDEEPSSAITNYKAYISQDVFTLMAHVPVIKKSYFRLEAFGGYGFANTTMQLRTATQDGEMKSFFLDNPVSMVGGAAALGYRNYYLFVEAGAMGNKAGGLTKTGTLTTSVDKVDLSGSYFLLGFMYDGNPFSMGSSGGKK